MSKYHRAIIITVDTALAGKPVKKGTVMLIPEDISEDTARSLMRMTRSRADKASDSDIKKRLAEYKKEQDERTASK